MAFSFQTANNNNDGKNDDNNNFYNISEELYWIRPYFTRNKKQHLLRPCDRSASCHQLSSTYSSSFHTLSPTSRIRTHPSPYIVIINLPNGEHLHIPLPHRHKSTCQDLSTSLVNNNLMSSNLEKNIYR